MIRSEEVEEVLSPDPPAIKEIKKKLKIDFKAKLKIDELIASDNRSMREPTLAEIYIAYKEDKVLYCPDLDRYLVFNGQYYEQMPYDKVSYDIFNLGRALYENKKIVGGYRKKVEEAAEMIKFYLADDKRVLSHDLPFHLIAFNDGIYDLRTSETHEFSADLKVFKYIDADIKDFGKPCSEYDRYLETTLILPKDDINVPDPQLIDLYEEMLATVISTDPEIVAAFFLIGGGANGKSVTTELLLNIFGEEYASVSSLKNLTSQFGTSVLRGKLVNICSEEQSQFLQHDVLKAIITHDKIQFEQKFKQASSFRPLLKMVFSTNNMPKFKQLDRAIKRRFILIPFNRCFAPVEQDKGLAKKLIAEKSQIIGRAVQAYQRLRENNMQFSDCLQSKHAMWQLEEDSSSAVQYFNDFYEWDDLYKSLYSAKEIYLGKNVVLSYEDWANKFNTGSKMGIKVFGRMISGMEGAEEYKKIKENMAYYYVRPKEQELEDVPDIVGQDDFSFKD